MRTRRYLSAIAFAVVTTLALAACGQPADSTAAATDAGVDAGPTITGSQMIFLAQDLRVGGQAIFMNAQAKAGERCAPQKLDTCLVFDCRTPDGAPAAHPAVARAGTVTIAGGSGGDAEFDPEDDGTYLPQRFGAGFFSPGNKLTFAIQKGADLPSASAQLTMPEPLDGIAPAQDTTLVDPAQPFGMTWTKSSGSAWLLLVETNNDGWLADLQVACEFDAAAGSGAVPPSVLALFRTGDAAAGWAHLYGLFHAAQKDLVVAGYPIKVLAWSGPMYSQFAFKE